MEHKILNRYPIGNKRFAWKQKQYAITTFSGFPQSGTQEGDINEVADKYAKYLKEAGFNLLELGWVEHEGAWAAVEACEKNQVDLILQDLSMFGGMSSRHVDRKCTEEELKVVTDKVKDKKYTIGYYVWDEPQTEEQMAEARRQMDILQKLDPDALLFTVAVPDYNRLNHSAVEQIDAAEDPEGDRWENGRYVPYIERFADKMDPPVMSFDYYPVGDYFSCWPGHTFSYEKQLDDSFMLLSMAVSRDVAKKHNIPFWFYYQGFKLYKCTKEEDFIFPMVRCFMYAAVLYGAKGLQNYATGQKGNRVMLPDGSKGAFYEDQKKINFEIKALGNTLMALDSKRIIHSDDVLPDCEYTKPYFNTIEESAVFAGPLPKRTSVGELEDTYGNTYVVVQNRDFYKLLSCELALKDTLRIYEVSKEDGKQRVLCDSTDTLPVELAPGDAMLIRVQKASEAPYTIEYQLAD